MKEEKEPSTKDPFFIWFYIDEEIAVAQGRGGGTAFWCRCRRFFFFFDLFRFCMFIVNNNTARMAEVFFFNVCSLQKVAQLGLRELISATTNSN